MGDLRLKYVDQDGIDRSVAVEADEFVLGRQPNCDLVLPFPGVSREHAMIERSGIEFVIRDLGSSFGTRVNGIPIAGLKTLSNGDEIEIGDSVTLDVEISADASPPEVSKPEPALATAAATPGNGTTVSVSSSPQAVASGGSNNIIWLAVLAPLTAVFLLIFIGGGLYLWNTSGQTNRDIVSNSDDPFADDLDDDRPSNVKGNDISGTSSSSNSSPPPSTNSGSSTSSSNTSSGTTTSQVNGTVTPPDTELGKVERHAAMFMRKAARNDPRAFITSEHAGRVQAKIREMAGSPGVAANLDSARKNSSSLASLANANGLKPHFLTAAALGKLGTSRGDVLKTAQEMVEVLAKLNAQVGSERGDDAAVLIAAYQQGVAGDFLKMRNMLQKLATEFPESAREIRSIWFLEQKQKISKAEFDNALRFLAVGTLMQNPKDFGVNSEPIGD